MNDKTILTALLGSGKISEEEEDAFRSMLERLDLDPRGNKTLSDRQRKWANIVYDRLKLADEEPSKNLFSSGKVPKSSKPVPIFPWELNRPLKPPGRS